ncbi:cell division protein FtsK [Staphylococcus equorum]|uniref:cell division protein FtsK n=1 Tax=Staphylococcus equorum TaxID=246432 RepID=UPI000D1C607A|nr:cell division protein FtsK [Staphylococcus equorum]PTE37741.1 cell division protein FtsK [Staphylococcus equorum]
MLKQNRTISTSRIQNGISICTTLIFLTVITLIISIVDSLLKIGVTQYSNPFLITIIVSIIIIQALIWMIRNKGYKGIKYAFTHYSTVLSLRKAFLDSKYYNIMFRLNKKIAQLPRIKINFEKGLSIGKLYIENIHMEKDLSKSNISIALKNYVVERRYLSRNEKFYIFEIYDYNINRQFSFHNLNDFKQQTLQVDDSYQLFVDKHTNIPIHSSLFVGQTGSGKTYALYSLILQMILKKETYKLYFADPKDSSLSVIGEAVDSNHSASSFDSIIKLLQDFSNLMNQYKPEIKEKLITKLDASYSDFGYPAHVFIFDEFASFQTELQAKEKKKRDEVMTLISSIILEGRQLGFFIWFVMQKSDSHLIPTYIRENIPVKFVLGNSEKQTYVTAFGPDIDVREVDFQLGEGLFVCPLIANQPKICHFSYLDFNILNAVEDLNE